MLGFLTVFVCRMKNTNLAGIAALFLFTFITIGDAYALTIRVRCESRGTERSKISVDAFGLPKGKYYTIISSGGSKLKSTPQPTVGKQVEFDFDSDPDDIAAGAMGIAPAFIQTGKVKAGVRSAKNNKLQGGGHFVGTCKVREASGGGSSGSGG